MSRVRFGTFESPASVWSLLQRATCWRWRKTAACGWFIRCGRKRPVSMCLEQKTWAEEDHWRSYVTVRNLRSLRVCENSFCSERWRRWSCSVVHQSTINNPDWEKKHLESIEFCLVLPFFRLLSCVLRGRRVLWSRIDTTGPQKQIRD